MNARQWMEQNGKRVGDRRKAITACMAACGLSDETAARKAWRAICGGDSSTAAPVATKSATKKADAAESGKTIADFRKVFDIPLRIREGIRNRLSGCYMTDQEFREACGVLSNQWRRYADDREFAANRGRFAGQLLWAQEKMMAQMKHIAGIPEGV